MNAEQRIAQGVLGFRRIAIALQADPKAIAQAKKARQAQASVGGNGSFADHDFADTPLRHVDFLGKPVLGDTQRFKELFRQDFARMGRGSVSPLATSEKSRVSRSSIGMLMA